MTASRRGLSSFDAAASVFLLLGLLACAATAGAQEIRDTSFLKQESQLQPGRGGQAQLVYINHEVDFSRYDKAVVDRVELWFRDKNASGAVEPAEQRFLAGYFTAALRHQMQLEFHPVETAQAGALRVRAAITQLSEGGASVEMEIVDSVSGTRLAAIKDAQVSKGSLVRVFDAWAERASERLGAFRRFDAAETAPSKSTPH